MTTEQEISYTNKSNNIVTDLRLVGENGCEINYTNLMSHIHEIEKLVGYCGRFSLNMTSREGEE